MRELKPSDFKQESIDNGSFHYWICTMANGMQLIIEPSTFGFTASVYDHQGIIQHSKRRIGWVHDMLALTHSKANTTFETAVKQVQDLYQCVLSSQRPGMFAAHYNARKGVLTLP